PSGGAIMNPREIDELAREIAEKLTARRRPPGQATASTPKRPTVQPSNRPAVGPNRPAVPPSNRPEERGGMVPAPSRLADYIDHTLLKPEATRAEIDRLCAEAREYR